MIIPILNVNYYDKRGEAALLYWAKKKAPKSNHYYLSSDDDYQKHIIIHSLIDYYFPMYLDEKFKKQLNKMGKQLIIKNLFQVRLKSLYTLSLNTSLPKAFLDIQFFTTALEFYNLINTTKTINDDFLLLFSSKKFTDSELFGYKIHQKFVEFRLNCNLLKIEKQCKNSGEKEKLKLLKWVYGERFQDLDNFVLLEKLGINWPEKKTLGKDLKKMFEDDISKDFSIIIDSQLIKTHKILLQARSGLYRSLFLTVKDELTQVNDYKGHTVDGFKLLLRFLYTDKLDKQNNNSRLLLELKDAVDYYQLNINSRLEFYMK
ncbi:hypothetical protein M0813_10748 [Anaeramoeba flamelloides]|uniref:BTB domain-containing protein n=1 Tax=Anaeramoeba flamelloides TaxID=1746091 RepID=A0ABQ8X2A1_9EUKA|nr:hypothetical protein M0813_10748 [Anaeramoeba flamelloides]